MRKADHPKCPPRCIKRRKVPGFLYCDRCPDQTLAKAREVLADYDAGRPLRVRGVGWLVRFAAAIVNATEGGKS